MWRNYLSAAFNNLARNRLFAALNILGLAVGLTVAIFTGLYVRDELSFDRFIPGHEKVWVMTSTVRSPGQPDAVTDYTPTQIAPALKLTFPQIKATARLVYAHVSVRRGQVEATEEAAWVDPTFFDILPLPALAGDPRAAVRDPGGVVITRSVALKYFGREAPLGEMLQFDRQHDLKVEAVIRDLPQETHLKQSIFASGRASFSKLSLLSAPGVRQGFENVVLNTHGPEFGPIFDVARSRLYLQIDDPRQARAVATGLPGFLRPYSTSGWIDPSQSVALGLVPLMQLHTFPFRGTTLRAVDRQADLTTLSAMGLIASVVLVLAGINFINLTIARAGRRAVEVGVRKAAGAARGQLVVQFMGESLIYAAIAMILAIVVVELSLPAFSAFLERSITFDYWRDPILALSLLAAMLALGLLAGLYPALVLSSYRPATVIKGGPLAAGGVRLVPQALVVFQFAVLVTLIIAAMAIWGQTQFAMNAGMRLDKDQMLIVQATACRGAFLDEVRQTTGVKAAACSSRALLGLSDYRPSYDSAFHVPGRPLSLSSMEVTDFGFFELYGVRPIAGRLFSRDHPTDELPALQDGVARHGPIILNETAARRLGFADPRKAVGNTVVFDGHDDRMQVVGVVPDFTVDLTNAPVKPQIYLVDFGSYPLDQIMSIKLDGARIPETVAAIDRLWLRTRQHGPIRRQFLDTYVNGLYLNVLRQGALVTAQGLVALLLSCLGLLGLAAMTAERRTKEIGVRKAMGASTSSVLRLLVWQFTQPVLLANLIAWPVAWWAMSRWLSNFAYHIDLTLWRFALASAATVAIAWLTVGAHALIVARAKPVLALRYE